MGGIFSFSYLTIKAILFVLLFFILLDLQINLNPYSIYNNVLNNILYASGSSGNGENKSDEKLGGDSEPRYRTYDEVAPSHRQLQIDEPLYEPDDHDWDPSEPWHPFLRDLEGFRNRTEERDDLSDEEKFNTILDNTVEKLDDYKSSNPDNLSPRDLERIVVDFTNWLTDLYDMEDLHYKHPFYGSDNDERKSFPSSENPSKESETVLETEKRDRSEDSDTGEGSSKRQKTEGQGSLIDDYADTSGEMPDFYDE